MSHLLQFLVVESSRRHRVVIIGGGFGGLTAARRLRASPVEIVLVDRRNHHLFQPLLYQVATASLSPADIAQPIRHILARQKNARVMLGEASHIDVDQRIVRVCDEPLPYDTLIIATGASSCYFGHDDWSSNAPTLKTIEDAVEIRRRFLLAFEAAEREENQESRRAELTFIVIGGGPTGVELAGAMIEIAKHAIPHDFRSIDTKTARVILVEANERVLAAFPTDASERARRDLQRLGVEVRTSTLATEIDAQGVWVESKGARERIDARNIIWAAGVKASPLAASLGAPLDHAGRVKVEPDLSIPGHPEVFVIGDLAHVETGGHEVPGVAPAAMQMGRFVGALIDAERRGGVANRPKFHYHDKGLLATIGRGRAVAHVNGRTFGGMLAWWLWAVVHIFFLIGFRSRVAVIFEWSWQWLTWQRGARLITEEGAHSSSRSTTPPPSS